MSVVQGVHLWQGIARHVQQGTLLTQRSLHTKHVQIDALQVRLMIR